MACRRHALPTQPGLLLTPVSAISGIYQANKASRAVFLSHEFHSMTQGDLSIDAYC